MASGGTMRVYLDPEDKQAMRKLSQELRWNREGARTRADMQLEIDTLREAVRERLPDMRHNHGCCDGDEFHDSHDENCWFWQLCKLVGEDDA